MGLAQVEILCYDKLDKIFKGGCHISLWTLLQIETRKDCIFRFFQRKSSGSA